MMPMWSRDRHGVDCGLAVLAVSYPIVDVWRREDLLVKFRSSGAAAQHDQGMQGDGWSRLLQKPIRWLSGRRTKKETAAGSRAFQLDGRTIKMKKERR